MKGKGNKQRWKGIPTEKNMKTNKETMVEHSQPICRQCQEQTASAKQNQETENCKTTELM